MTEYQKIETLYRFNAETHLYDPVFYNPTVEYLKDLPWIASEKIDGTNIRVHYDGHRVSWSGRTDSSDLPKEVEALLQSTFGESEVTFEQQFGDKDVILFMECYGGKIQGGAYGGSERLIGFDVMVGGIYLDKFAIAPIFSLFGVETVTFFMIPNLQTGIDWVAGRGALPSPHCEKGRTPVEGLVCVPQARLYDHMGRRIAVKIKARDLRKLAPAPGEGKAKP